MEQYKRIAETLKSADAIIIGASNGLSITEGLNLFASNREFYDLFGDFSRKYNFHNILEGCFYRYPDEKEKWAYWSRLIYHYTANYKGSPVMDSLKEIVKDKPYFIVTSNGEAHFEKAGFSKDSIFEIEGSWEHLQCSRACHGTLYPATDIINKMAQSEQDGKIPESLVPYCPKCGAPMSVHIATDKFFIPNSSAQQRFNGFLEKYRNKRLVVLELGIGARNQMIKAPLMSLVYSEPNSAYITFNKGEIFIPEQIKEKSIGVDGLLSDIFAELMKEF